MSSGTPSWRVAEVTGGFPLIWSPSYEVDIGGHVFPTAKYRLVLEALVATGVIREDEVLSPGAVSWDVVGRIHGPAYVSKIRNDALSSAERLTLEVPFSAALRDASLLCCGGTLLTSELALSQGFAAHLGGGFHHAFRDHGEGFCLLNDVAVAVSELLARGTVERVAIVDLDVHQGNGTAAIFGDEPRVFTLSLHQERNYPNPKPPGDLDVELPDGITDEAYLGLLEGALSRTLERHDPQLVVYLAGADPYEDDQLGGLSLTRGGLETRDRMVLSRCGGEDIPVAVVLAGGYARRQEDTVGIHQKTVEVTKEFWEGPRGP